MTPLAPRQLVHRGVVDAAAFLIDTTRSMRDAHDRVVRVWSRGASVHRVGDALLVQLAAPRRADCARAPGLPLVRLSPSSVLASAPLAPDEIDAAGLSAGAIAIVRGGVITAIAPRDAEREDPASYLDVDGFDVVSTEPLGAPPAAAKVVGAQTNSAPRAILHIGDAPPEHAAVLEAMTAMREGRALTSDDGGAAPRVALSIVAALFAAIGGLLGALFMPRAPSPALPPRAGDTRGLAAMPAEPAGPSLAERVGARMRSLIAELLVRARLASLIGKRQAEYMQRLLDMLDRGDLGEALRHAIPLGGDDPGHGASAPLLGVPEPRQDFSISLRRERPAASMFAATDLYAHLRAKYRAAFERLEREGRIDEAAFVLAELLREVPEAVAFLERHDRLRLAAELAEARRLPPGLVVRQWFLAGDAARAVLIARRHGAFADAISRLGEHPSAPALRVLWAETLAEAGDFAAAIDVIWPVEGARGIARAWLDRAIAGGGALAARMLVKKLALVRASFPEVRDAAQAIFDDRGPRASRDRRALGEALAIADGLPEARVLARAAARALAKDSALSGDHATQALVSKLVVRADDAALRADMPAWPTVVRAPLAQVGSARVIEIDAADRGTMEIHDAAHLPNGNLLVALGEAGARVIARSGKALFHLDEPAHALVVSDHGDRAIAVANRGAAKRLARLDLAGRRSEPWCEATIDAAAPTFDGAQWVICASGRLFVIDAFDTSFHALHAIDLGDATPLSLIARSPSSCTLAVSKGDAAVRERYELPSWTLRARTPLDVWGEGMCVSAEGAIVMPELRKPDQRLLSHRSAKDIVRHVPLDGDASTPIVMTMSHAWIACAIARRDRVEALLFDEGSLLVRARVILHGARRASLHLTDDTWTIVTDSGRALVIDLAHGDVMQNLRV